MRFPTLLGFGYATPAFDTKFKSAEAFNWIAAFFGLLCFLTLALASCCPLTPQRMKCMSIYFFFAFFFQAMTFLLFRSDACSLGFFAPYFGNDPPPDDIVTSVSCGLSKGSNMAIAATVLYFLCMNMAPAAVPPRPIVMTGGDDAGGAGGGNAEGE